MARRIIIQRQPLYAKNGQVLFKRQGLHMSIIFALYCNILNIAYQKNLNYPRITAFQKCHRHSNHPGDFDKNSHCNGEFYVKSAITV